MSPVLDRELYLAQWSALHGDVPPTGVVGAWLRLVHALVRPLVALRVPPWTVTLSGAVLALLALWPARALPGVAALLVGLSGACDGLDGTLALVTGRAGRLGALLDAACDRVADLCFPAALWLAGAPPWPALAAAALAWAHEYLRAVAAELGMRGIGVITVAERPTRLIVTMMFLLAAQTPVLDAAWWATAGTVALIVLGVVGLVQLVLAIRRALRRAPA